MEKKLKKLLRIKQTAKHSRIIISNTLGDSRENLDALQEYIHWCFDAIVMEKDQSSSSSAKNEKLSSKRSLTPPEQHHCPVKDCRRHGLN